MRWSLSRPIWNGKMQVKHKYLKIAGYSSRQQHLCKCIYNTRSVGTIESGNKAAQMLLLLSLILNQPKKKHWRVLQQHLEWHEVVVAMATPAFTSVWRGCTGTGPSDTDELSLTSQTICFLFSVLLQKGPFVAGQNFHHKREYSHSHYWCHSWLLWVLRENFYFINYLLL